MAPTAMTPSTAAAANPTARSVAAWPAKRSEAENLFFKLAIAAGILVLVVELGYLAYSLPSLPLDVGGFVVGRDFIATWIGAKLAFVADPGRFFGFEAYNGLLRAHFGAEYPWHIWSYPPHRLLLIWPWAFVPYLWGYVLYSLIGLALYLVVVARNERRWDHLLLLVLSPAVIVNVWTGQNGFFTCTLLIGGLTLLDRRPLLAGVLFGFLSLKPQLGVLLPVMLLLTGRWRTIAATAATVAALFVVTCLVFGVDVWVHYVKDALPYQRRMFLEVHGFFLAHMPTVFANLRVAWAPLALCFGLQAVMSALALGATVWTFARKRDPQLSTMLYVTSTFLVTPYAFNYDMVVFGWVILKLLDRDDNTAWDYWLMLAVWVLPFVTVVMGVFDLPGSFLPLAAFAGRLLWRMRRAEQPEGHDLHPRTLSQPMPAN